MVVVLSASTAALVILLSVALSQLLTDPRIVRPYWNPNRASDLSDRPIETTLHKYDHTSRTAYLTTGESITFRFPAAYYWRKDNQRGGPQYEIALALDYAYLDAAVPKLRALESIRATDDQKRRHAEIAKRLSFVHVLSSLRSQDTPMFKISDGAYTYVGEYCDLAMYVDPNDRWRETYSRADPEPLSYPFSEAETFVSAARIHLSNSRLDGDYQFKVHCEPYVRRSICVVDSYFEDWPIKFLMPKDRLCQWRQESARMQDFLASHVARRTLPSAREQTRY
jgi:hypothetical protein